METANTNPEAKVSENPEQIEEDKKNKTILIKKILFITIGILLLFLIILALVFILKSEEPKESTESAPAIEQTAKENENNTENIPPEPEIKETKFDFNKLEPEKLNEQLELLTNKNMIYQKEKEQKILEEEKKLSPVLNLVNNLKNKEENKEEIATTPAEITNTEENKKEEVLKSQEVKQETKEEVVPKKTEALTTNDETQTKKNIEEPTKTTAESLTFVKLINVAKIKGDLNKKYFDKVIEVNANVLLCRDDENIIELYYGPFLEDEIRDNLLSKLIKNGFKEAYSLEMTKEEFDKRCNY